MASVTVYRFRIELSDVDRGVYETLDLRTALHASETHAYLITRVLAFALNMREGLAFSPGGLSDPDAPALLASDPQGGGVELWIEIGNPSARKLHKASKAARQVKVYTYKDPALLLKDIAPGEVHRAGEIEIVSFDPRFLERVAAALQKDNPWTLTVSEGVLFLGMPGGRSEQVEPGRHALS
jgi:uncharacterized protein YaeQ